MLQKRPKHVRTLFLTCVWAVALVIVNLVLSSTGMLYLTMIVFCLGVAGSMLGIALTVLQYRESQHDGNHPAR